MNFFFSIQTEDIISKLQIPKFSNKLEKSNNKINLYSLTIKNNTWNVELTNCNQDNDFYYLCEKNLGNEKIFFLSKEKEIEKLEEKNYLELLNIDNFTETNPAYRANLEIYNLGGGFSSYQSEYPFAMTTKQGGILSPLSTLLNVEADKNFIFFKNIYFQPVQKKFSYYIVDIHKKKLLKSGYVITNNTNVIEIDKKYIAQSIFFLTKDFIGIPIFSSIKENHISLEHTHPPHHYLWGEDKFKKIKELKDKCYEVIN